MRRLWRRAKTKDDAGEAAPHRCGHGKPETKINDLCDELGISSQTLSRYVFPYWRTAA
jgi:hypothetical protein